MTLPTSGPMSLSMIQTEFGGTNPIDLNEYYNGGLYVPNSSTNNNIPSSGTISLQDFYGGSNFRFVLTASMTAGSPGSGTYGYYDKSIPNPFSLTSSFGSLTTAVFGGYTLSAILTEFQTPNYNFYVCLNCSYNIPPPKTFFNTVSFTDNTSTLRSFSTSSSTYSTFADYTPYWALWIWSTPVQCFTSGHSYSINFA